MHVILVHVHLHLSINRQILFGHESKLLVTTLSLASRS